MSPTSITHVTLEVTDPAAADAFYSAAFGDGLPVRTRAAEASSTGFRGFTLGLDVAGPAGVDHLFTRAVATGGTALKAPRKQLWGGYSGVVQAPDGTVWKVATTAKKDDGRVDLTIERTILLLGVTDVKVTRQFYVDRGLVVAKSYGSKYVEYETGGGAVTLGLYKRAGLAKEFGVSADGTGSHRLAIGCDGAPGADPDGFVWESADARHT
jgi:catechol 2,3-dioxygenase-like lactoylglutathione lyase family enzyme